MLHFQISLCVGRSQRSGNGVACRLLYRPFIPRFKLQQQIPIVITFLQTIPDYYFLFGLVNNQCGVQTFKVSFSHPFLHSMIGEPLRWTSPNFPKSVMKTERTSLAMSMESLDLVSAALASWVPYFITRINTLQDIYHLKMIKVKCFRSAIRLKASSTEIIFMKHLVQ